MKKLSEASTEKEVEKEAENTLVNEILDKHKIVRYRDLFKKVMIDYANAVKKSNVPSEGASA